MKISLNWLRELVELPPTTEELVQLLTLAGVEVERVETSGCAVNHVVVARILESVRHPNADRLSVCKVDDGSGTVRQIVCGAKNYKVGDKVPLALPGARLAPDVVIKVGKLRGIESQGMMCSARELGLGSDAAGLLILPPDTEPGTPLATLFPPDTCLELEITPNRPDLLSVIGIAREVAALTGKPWQKPAPAQPASVAAAPALHVADTTRCPLYTARKIRGVKVGPSPLWLRTKLLGAGLRPINNIVDVTNFVMLETGQPLHAFDAAKISGALQARPARDGEEFLALDGRTYRLAPDHLVIADADKAVAIAGVMGGEETGVSEETTELWLESAWFQPQTIRRTSRTLGLASDSSYRFERGTDPEGVLAASQRAAELIAEIVGAAAVHPIEFGGQLAGLATPRVVPLRHARVTRLLGVEVPVERIQTVLTRFGLEPTAAGWRVPSFRSDLAREIDLIEEIARVIGMDAIPSRLQARFVGASASDAIYDCEMALRTALTAHGLHEARSLTLVPETPLGLDCMGIAKADLLRVKNPMIDDQVVLRPTLLHGLFSAVRDNLRAGTDSVRLFEIGRVFRAPATAADNNATPAQAASGREEYRHAAFVLCGPSSARSWRAPAGRAFDLFDVKGILADVLRPGVTFERSYHSGAALALVVKVAGVPVGIAGQLWPADARALDASHPVVFASLDLEALDTARPLHAAAGRYREISRYPATSRDIALIAGPAVTHADVLRVLETAAEPLLVAVELFDVFADPSGEKLPPNHRSLAYSLTYRANDRTLTADEANATHQRLKERLKAELGVTLRE